MQKKRGEVNMRLGWEGADGDTSNSKTCQSLHVVGSQQPVDQLMMRTKESEANEIGVRLKIRLELGWHLFKVGGDGG